MRASVAAPLSSKSHDMEVPKKSAMASSKKRRVPGRHISFAAAPTFFCIAENVRSASPVSACNSKVCLCSPTNHPGSFRCRLHRGSSMTKPVTPPAPVTYRKKMK